MILLACGGVFGFDQVPAGKSAGVSPPDPARAPLFPTRPAMEDHAPPPGPKIPARKLGLLLHDPARWQLLRELAKGEALPVRELARRIGKTHVRTSQHLLLMREWGLLVKEYGHTYRLAPAHRPAPGATHLDFGDWMLRL